MATHHLTSLLKLAADGDSRAPGGAITKALCGHWDHDGPCRWPHLTKADAGTDGVGIHLEVTCPDEDLDEVLTLVREALAAGILEGPDGRWTHWTVLTPLRSS